MVKYILTMYIFVFLFGIIIGSFLNVCIFRLPLGQSIITTPSHCTKCNKKIKWYDLVPVISYIFLGGKCRYCKTIISIRYPLIELLNGFLWALSFYVYGFTANALITSLMISALIIIGFMDFDTQLINIPVCFVIGLLGISKIVFVNSLSLKEHLIGLVAISVPMALIYLFSKGKAIGSGDIYFMAATGLFLGFKLIILAAFVGILIGAAVGIIYKIITKNNSIAFGPFLSIGTLVSALYGEQIINFYINFIG